MVGETLCKSIANQHPKVHFSCVPEIANPATNRNRGAMDCGADMDVISFIDADGYRFNERF